MPRHQNTCLFLLSWLTLYRWSVMWILLPGQVGWGISWYIEDMLIPELTVRRGSTYTFVIEGGTDVSNPARYHPFYITDSISGGRLQNDQATRNVSDWNKKNHFLYLATVAWKSVCWIWWYGQSHWRYMCFFCQISAGTQFQCHYI